MVLPQFTVIACLLVASLPALGEASASSGLDDGATNLEYNCGSPGCVEFVSEQTISTPIEVIQLTVPVAAADQAPEANSIGISEADTGSTELFSTAVLLCLLALVGLVLVGRRGVDDVFNFSTVSLLTGLASSLQRMGAGVWRKLNERKKDKAPYGAKR